MSDRIIIV